ncbi:AP-2 complex subunit alpha-1 [Striga asiatica]|uniref:AP-2 complex subunit alpha-1 n=1 Tax=Striga asiatica TaxID=4170 RepID=A0A5A7PNS6_STRAF|nr:AP-2 complex subunit alpha-1 [Striga asiatica]
MLYISMLGYDVDFGHMEAVSLISAPKYPEKQVGYTVTSCLLNENHDYLRLAINTVGYIVTSCLLNENHDFLRLAINTVRNDIIGRNETFQCLTVTLVGNIGGREFAESLAPDVQKLLISSSCRPLVRKKAALCLLRLYRENPDVVNVDGRSDRMAQLLDERDLGVLTSSMSLLVALVSNNHEAYWSCLPKCVKVLERLARNQDVPQEYTYYGIPSPWFVLILVKTMRALQYFPTIEDPNTIRSLFEVLQRILMGTDVVKNVNKNNASHAVLFEALALVMHLDAEKEMMSQCVALLGKFIAVREPNIRYLGLFGVDVMQENMTRMLMVTDYLSSADFAMQEELSLKAVILAEKFSPDLYVDVILQLIDKAGDFVSDDIWFRVVQFVTNNEDLQAYAALKAREYLDKPAIHETMVKVCDILFIVLIYERLGCNPKEIFQIIHEKLPTVSYESCIDAEIQQRAVEYHALSLKGAALMDILLKCRSSLKDRFSSLIKKADDSEADTAEQSAIKLRAQQQSSSALVVSDQRPANGAAPVSQLSLVKVPSVSNADQNSTEQGLANANGALTVMDPEPPSMLSPDLLGDLLGPLAMEGPLDTAPQSESRAASGLQVGANQDAFAIATVEEQAYTVQIGIKSEWQAHHGRVVLFLGNKNTASLVSVQALILPPLHLKMELSLVPETIPPRAQARIETDPADRTQLRMTIASGDPTLTFELKEFIKEQLVSIPFPSRAPVAIPPQAQPTSPPSAVTDPVAILASLL